MCENSISFFSRFCMHQYQILLDAILQALILCLLLFKNILSFLNLLSQAVGLTWIIALGSSPSKLISSRLIPLKIYTKNNHFIWHYQNLQKKSRSSLALKELQSFSIILLVRNQSRTIFNADRKSSTAFTHIFWVFYLSWQCFSMKGSLETTLLHISLVLYWSKTELNTKDKYQQFYHIYIFLILALRNKLHYRRRYYL